MDGPGLFHVPGVISYGIRTLLGHNSWYHGMRLGRSRRTLASGVCKPPARREHHGQPREVLPVLQQPLCSLPVLTVATMLDVGALLMHDRHLWRIIPVAEGQRSMAVMVGSKQLARIQGDDGPGRITEVLQSLPEGEDNVAAIARHMMDALRLETVVEAR